MDLVQEDTKDIFAMPYVDDLVVFSHMFEEQLEHLPITLDGMRGAGMTVNPGIVQLAASRVKLLGYVVDRGTVRPSEDKFKAVLEYPPFHNEKSLPWFIGNPGFP